MRVMPASSAAWIVRMACASSGRPETESGMAPRPIGNTSTSPSRRVAVLVVALIGVAYPVGRPAGERGAPGVGPRAASRISLILVYAAGGARALPARLRPAWGA